MTWNEAAACRDMNPNLFYPPDSDDGARGETATEKRRREGAALAVCARCPVEDACRQDALDRRDDWGVQGGTTGEERRKMRRRRRQADPYPTCVTCGRAMSRDRDRPARVHLQATNERCLDCWQAARAFSSDAGRPTRAKGKPRGRQTLDVTDELRAAHAAYQRGERTARICELERAYRVAAKRGQRERKKGAA